jgi:two-component system, LytTR family, sensor kinase
MRQRAGAFLAILGGYTALALFLAAANYLTYLSTSGTAYWWPTLKRALGEWWAWAALTPLILYLARRWPIERGTMARSSAVHVAAMVFIGVLKLVLDQRIRILLFGSAGYLLFTNLAFNFLIYWAIVAAAHGGRYYRTGRERELQSSRLEARLAETRLQLLNMQLQPHFLFNTLNAISELVHEDPDTADRMIAGLSVLLRETLAAGNAPAVSVQRELDLLACYVDIQRARFGARLDATTDVDPRALDAAIPVLLLQTVVENAIRHGLARRTNAGRIDVAVRRDSDRVTVTVRDDGDGLEGGRPEGLGISNTRARLHGLFGATHELDVANADGGGVRVTITFPYRTVEEVEAG